MTRGERGAYVAARKSALTEALAAEPAWSDAERAGFREVARRLTALIHYQTLDELERLKDLYAPFDPAAPKPLQGGDPSAFVSEIEAILAQADFKEASSGTLLAEADRETLADVRVRTRDAGVRTIRFFLRGARRETFSSKRFFGLVPRAIETDVIDDVVVLVLLKSHDTLDPQEAKDLARARRGVRPGAVLLKHFSDVPHTELRALHPGAEPTMRRQDQLMLGVPAIAAGVPLVTQIINAATVIFAVLAAYFGYQGAIDESRLKQALAALSGFVALGAYVMRQRLKLDRQKLLYQKRLSDTVYFHTVANNEGVIDGLVNAAEHQEAKEALLAYGLLRLQGPMTKADLDAAAETFIAERFGLQVNFDVADALAKLERFGLSIVTPQGLAGVDTAQALRSLDAQWGAAFRAT